MSPKYRIHRLFFLAGVFLLTASAARADFIYQLGDGTFESSRNVPGDVVGLQSGTKVGRLDRSGSTATFFYSFGEQFLSSIKNQGKFNDWWPKTYQPFVRFDTFNNNTNVSGSKITITTYGFNLFFAETTKAQINYNRRVQQNGSSPDVKSNELLAQLQFGF